MVGEENESRKISSSRAMESLSLEINRYPRDLLQRFMSTETTSKTPAPSEGEDAEEGIELNLGLSLGGRFGVDKTCKKNKLTRSSSVAGSISLLREHDAFSSQPVSYPSLMRTSSLPTETEEEWRKRKELQSLRRMEAKRRRSEKQKNLNSNSRGGELNLEEEERRGLNSSRGNWTPTWARQVGIRGTCLQGFLGQQQGSQGSVESQGGSSSGLSEMESKSVPGSTLSFLF